MSSSLSLRYKRVGMTDVKQHW